MAKMMIKAVITIDGKAVAGKREVNAYDGSDDKTKDANVGLILREQASIRRALVGKYGDKKVSPKAVADLSKIEAV